MDCSFLVFRIPLLIYNILQQNDDDEILFLLFKVIGALYVVFYFIVLILFNKTYRRIFKKYTKIILNKILKFKKRNRVENVYYNRKNNNVRFVGFRLNEHAYS